MITKKYSHLRTEGGQRTQTITYTQSWDLTSIRMCRQHIGTITQKYQELNVFTSLALENNTYTINMAYPLQ